MKKTRIEWCNYTVNPIKGLCKHGCPYCYANRMSKRFKWNPEVRLDMSVFNNIYKLPKGSKIFVCSTHDIMGNWIPDEWIKQIIDVAFQYPEYTFMYLTKNPIRYLDFNFYHNIWLGATYDGVNKGLDDFTIKIDNKFVSIEPLLADIENKFKFIANNSIEWLIVGGLSPKPVHKKEWVDKIIEFWKANNLPLFLKSNLHYPEILKQYPNI